jgi:hypothetical protein
MTHLTDDELLRLCENADADVAKYGASAPLLTLANAARTALPRLIIEREELRTAFELNDKALRDLMNARNTRAEKAEAEIERMAAARLDGMRSHTETIKERDAIRAALTEIAERAVTESDHLYAQFAQSTARAALKEGQSHD